MTREEKIAAIMARQASPQQPLTREAKISAIMAKQEGTPARPSVASSVPEGYVPPISDTEGESSRLQKFGEGVASSALNTAYGIKDLFGGETSKERKAELKGLSKSAGESGYGTTGKVAGELAQFLLPTGVLGAGAKVLSRVPKAAKVAKGLSKAAAAMKANPIKSDIAIATALGGSKITEGEGLALGERVIGAVKEGALGAAGGGAAVGTMKLLGKAAKAAGLGVKATPEGRELLRAGGQYSPAQIATSPMIRGVESIAEVTPFLATGVKAVKQEGIENFSRHALNKTMKQISDEPIEKIGKEGYQQLSDAISKGYDDAWATSKGMSKAQIKKTLDNIDEALPNFGVEEAAKLKALRANVVKLSKDGSPAQLRSLDSRIRKYMKTAKNDPDLLEVLSDARIYMRQSLPEEGLAKLIKVDRAYPSFLVIQDATAKAAGDSGKFTPQQLIASAKKIGATSRVAEGTSPLIREADIGMSTVGRKDFGQPLSFLRRISATAPSPTKLMKGAAKWTTGQTAPQRKVRAGLKAFSGTELAKALREMEKYGGMASGRRLGAGAASLIE